jgi:hypothetical protein
VPQTANNGATSYQIGTALGTYLGSVFVDASAGQVTCNVSYGQSRKWGIWNAFNRLPIYIREGDPTATWTGPNSSITTFRPSNNNVSNQIATFTGLPEEVITCGFVETMNATNNPGNPAAIAIGVNSTSIVSGTKAVVYLGGSGQTAMLVGAATNIVPGIGVNNVQALEAANGGPLLYGTEANMLLTARYNG